MTACIYCVASGWLLLQQYPGWVVLVQWCNCAMGRGKSIEIGGHGAVKLPEVALHCVWLP